MTPEQGRARLAPVMEATYQPPFERFERYCPVGPPEVIADGLAPYVDAGAAFFNVLPISRDVDEGVNAAAEIRRLLNGCD